MEEDCDRMDLHADAIKDIIQDLDDTFHSEDAEKAYEAFSRLRWNDIFGAMGGRIMMNLLPKDRRAELSTVVVEATGSNREDINVVFTGGNPSRGREVRGRRALYDFVKNIQTTIFNRGFDLRLQGVHGDLDYLNP